MQPASHPGNSKGLRRPVSETRVKDQIVEQKLFLVQSVRKLQVFQEFVVRNLEQKPIFPLNLQVALSHKFKE